MLISSNTLFCVIFLSVMQEVNANYKFLVKSFVYITNFAVFIKLDFCKSKIMQFLLDRDWLIFPSISYIIDGEDSLCILF